MNPSIDNPETLAGSYLALAQVFSYPDPAAWQRLKEHGLVDPELTREALEADYLATFEMGGGRAKVSLYEGQNRPEQGRDGILQELLRFYEFFDAQLSPENREYPDHIATELEFLGWLCLQEHAARRDGRDAEPFLRASGDFLNRHLAAWLPEFGRRLEAAGTAYAHYVPALGELVEAHLGRIGEQAPKLGEMQ